MKVKRRSLAVGIGGVLVGIEHLNFVTAHEIDAAVAPALPVSCYFTRRSPLDVKLNVANSCRSENITGAVDRWRIAIARLAIWLGPSFSSRRFRRVFFPSNKTIPASDGSGPPGGPADQ